MRLNKLGKTAVTALEDIKARDIQVIDVRKLTPLYDTMIIATADSARQTRSLASHVQERMKSAGAKVVGSEGQESGDWVLVDFGEVVVHIMQPATREYYNLEELWALPPARVLSGRGAAVAAAKGIAAPAVPAAERAGVAPPATKPTTAVRRRPVTARAAAVAAGPTGASTATRRAAAAEASTARRPPAATEASHAKHRAVASARVSPPTRRAAAGRTGASPATRPPAAGPATEALAAAEKPTPVRRRRTAKPAD